MTIQHKASESMTARTVSLTSSPNPIIATASRIRELQDDLTPRQREVREAGERRTRDLLATGAFSLSPRR